MSTDTLPRLAIQARSFVPDAHFELHARDGRANAGLVVHLPRGAVEVVLQPAGEPFNVIQSSIFINSESLSGARDSDLQRLVGAENAGLRGATVFLERRDRLRVSASFYAQKGRTRDEIENLVVDLLSLQRLARALTDRLQRSSTPDGFSFEIYQSLYLNGASARKRYINVARSIFQGSAERVFGQVLTMLTADHHYRAQNRNGLSASLSSASHPMRLQLSLPAEVPLIVCTTEPLDTGSASRALALALKLNEPGLLGHFETQGQMISFVTWKHLTNDLRYYSFDQLLIAAQQAENRLQQETHPASGVFRRSA